MDENTKQPLVATVIGTCRVHRPFQCLEREGLAIVKNRRASHYLHTTKEALQYLRYLQGEDVVPEELEPYVTAGNLKVPGPSMNAFDSDIFIIEISSQKEIQNHGIYLQLNFLMSEFSKQQIEWLEWWKLLQRQALGNITRERINFQTLSNHDKLDKQIYYETTLNLQSPEDLYQDMKFISEMVESPILFATHADVTGQNGEPIPSRQRWIEEVEQNAAKLGYPCFNPKALLMEHGQELAMEKQGKDVNHYSEEFYKIVGVELLQIAKNLIT